MSRRLTHAVVLIAALAGTPRAALGRDAPFGRARAEVERDLAAARQTLADLHTTVRKDRRTLLAEIETLRADLAAAREAAADLDAASAALKAETAASAGRAEAAAGRIAFLRTAAVDFRQAFDARLGPADAERLRERLEALDAQLEATDTVSPALLGSLLDLAVGSAEQSLGGLTYQGTARDPEGAKRKGSYARFGPVLYFSSDDGTLAGFASQAVGSTVPTCRPVADPETARAVASVVRGLRAPVPVDVTRGNALRLEEAEQSLTEHLRAGGVTMVPLFILAAVCSVLAIYKSLALVALASGRSRVVVAEIVRELNAGNTGAAEALARRLRAPLGPVIRQGLIHRDAPKEHLEEILYEQVISQVPRLERFLTPLAVCASAAPLLGLLGTVTGMIHTFRLITVFGTGDARLLSSGISEALVTTEVGLVIAIPALLIHAVLSRRVRRTVAMTQEVAVAFVNGLKLRPANGERAGEEDGA